MTAILIQQATTEYKPLLDLTERRHRLYAERHAMKYMRFDGAIMPGWHPYWNPVFLWLMLLMQEAQNDVAGVWHIDADALIVGDDDMRYAVEAGRIGMCWQTSQPEHWNIGVIFLRNSERVRDLLRATLERGPGGPPWYCQQIMNDLLAEPEWADLAQGLDHRWNSIRFYAEVADPQIVAWHGEPGADGKLAYMKAYMKANNL